MTISQMAGMNQSLGANSYGATQSAKSANDISVFQKILEQTQKNNSSSLSSVQTIEKGRLNGEYTSSYLSNNVTADKNSRPQGFAANAIGAHSTNGASNKTIDRTSKLYEKSLELEGFFVKMMLSSMRNTVQKSGLGGNNGFAGKMYEDMMYDELSVTMTKNAGFGLADQIYLSLADK